MQNWFKVFLILFILGLSVYWNSFNNKFMMDDSVFIANPVMSNAKFILSQWDPYREQVLGVVDSQAAPGYYRPLAHMVYDVTYDLFKKNYWQYHLFNLFLLVLASSLIYLFLEKVTGNYHLAFLTGLFYLIHPINGIIVNYTSANAFAFQVIFILGTLLLLSEALIRNNNRVFYFLSLFFSFLSLFWNDSGIMAPVYVSAFILLFGKDPFKRKALYLFPYFLIVFLYLVFRFLFLTGNEDIVKHIIALHMTVGEYLATLCQVSGWYISKLFYPQGIVMQWVTPMVHGHLSWSILWICSFLGLSLILFLKFAKEKIIQLAVLWFLIGFVPVPLAAFIMEYNGAQIEPHWFVFSSIGFFIGVAYGCSLLLQRMRKIGIVLVIALFFIWGTVSYAYNQLWANQKTYAQYWSQQVPDLKKPLFYLADANYREGNFLEAKEYYRLALSGHSSDAQIYINLGVIDMAEGHPKEAELNYKFALRIDPYSALTNYDLGILYYKEGRLEKAEEYFHRALRINPFLIEPRRFLAEISFKHSEYQKAIDLCLQNLDINNNDAKTLALVMDILIAKKDFVMVKEYAYRFINVESDPIDLTRMGVTMGRNNFPILALDCFSKAIRLDPAYSDAYWETGIFLENLGKHDEAVHMWRLGLSVNPSDQRFKTKLK